MTEKNRLKTTSTNPETDLISISDVPPVKMGDQPGEALAEKMDAVKVSTGIKMGWLILCSSPFQSFLLVFVCF